MNWWSTNGYGGQYKGLFLPCWAPVSDRQSVGLSRSLFFSLYFSSFFGWTSSPSGLQLHVLLQAQPNETATFVSLVVSFARSSLPLVCFCCSVPLSLLPSLSISILIYRRGKFVRFSTQSSETVYSHFLLPDSMYTLSCYQPFNATVAGHIAKLWKPEGNEHNIYTSAVLLDAPNWPRDRKTPHRISTFWYQRISVTSNKYTHLCSHAE